MILRAIESALGLLPSHCVRIGPHARPASLPPAVRMVLRLRRRVQSNKSCSRSAPGPNSLRFFPIM